MGNFLSFAAVRKKTSLSEPGIRRLVRAGKFPQPIEIVEGGRRLAFDEDEVEKWMEGRKKASRKKIEAKKAEAAD